MTPLSGMTVVVVGTSIPLSRTGRPSAPFVKSIPMLFPLVKMPAQRARWAFSLTLRISMSPTPPMSSLMRSMAVSPVVMRRRSDGADEGASEGVGAVLIDGDSEGIDDGSSVKLGAPLGNELGSPDGSDDG